MTNKLLAIVLLTGIALNFCVHAALKTNGETITIILGNPQSNATAIAMNDLALRGVR